VSELFANVDDTVEQTTGKIMNTTMTTTTTTPTLDNSLTAGSHAVVVKGCKSRNIRRGDRVFVKSVVPLGPEYSHQVMVSFTDSNGRSLVFYARHPNRLKDPVVNLNDGNPLHLIKLRKRT
jgi:hypothetical protein